MFTSARSLPLLVVAVLLLSGCGPTNTIDIDIVMPIDRPETLPDDPGTIVYGTTGTLDDLEELLGVSIPREDILASEAALGAAQREPFGPPAVLPVSLTGNALTVIPASMARSDSESVGEALLAGTIITGMLAPAIQNSQSVSELKVGQADGEPKTGASGTAQSSGGLKVSRTGENAVAIEVRSSTENGDVSTSHSVAIEGTICPADDGEFDFTVTLHNGAAGTGASGTGSAQQDLTAHFTGRLGENGYPESMSVDAKQGSRTVSPDGREVFVETRHTMSNANALNIFSLGDTPAEILRSSENATLAEQKTLATRGGARLAAFSSGAALGAASGMWSGGCVKIDATAPARVRAKSTTSIPVATRSALSGQQFAGKVAMALSGQSSIDKATLTAKDTVSYVAGKVGTTASITFTTESRRGSARLKLALSTSPQAYSATGGAGDFYGTGVICDLGHQFFIAGGPYSVTFLPVDTSVGSFYWADDGTIGGGLITLSVEGEYTVSYDDAGVATHITAPGKGTTTIPQIGTVVTENVGEFDLTPIGGTPAECEAS